MSVLALMHRLPDAILFDLLVDSTMTVAPSPECEKALRKAARDIAARNLPSFALGKGYRDDPLFVALLEELKTAEPDKWNAAESVALQATTPP